MIPPQKEESGEIYALAYLDTFLTVSSSIWSSLIIPSISIPYLFLLFNSLTISNKALESFSLFKAGKAFF